MTFLGNLGSWPIASHLPPTGGADVVWRLFHLQDGAGSLLQDLDLEIK